MPHIFIGGAARCGKSTLAREVRTSTNMQSLSGDAFRTTLRKTAEHGTFPVLHTPGQKRFLTKNHSLIITQQMLI